MINKRFDRLLTLYFFYYLSKLRTPKPRIPVLMYHSISNSSLTHVHPYYETSTHPRSFSNQMSYLHNNGYDVISIAEALQIMQSDQPMEHKYAVITFDDGFQDVLINALPILKQYNFKAIVYLPTDFISDKGMLFKNIRCLTWKEVKELQDNDIEIGSHTVTHPQLSSLRPRDVEYEICHSKTVIEDKLGTPCHSFSYPYAFPEEHKSFVTFLRNIMTNSGYLNSVSTIVGSMGKNEDKYFIKRLPVNSYDDETFFKLKLEGAYDWLHGPQIVFKYLKRHFNNHNIISY